MKKFLSLLMMSLLCVCAWAETVTFVAGEDKGANTSAGADQITKDGITLANSNGMLYTAPYRFYKSSTITITSTVGDITKVEFAVADGYAASNITGDGYADGVWSGTSDEVTLTSSVAQTRVNTVTVTYTPSTAASVAKPVINFEPLHPYQGETVTTTITCETEGATIQYALNDGDFQTYTEPFTLTETTTVKAKAVLDDATTAAPVESDVVTKTVTFNPTVANIAELTGLANNTYFKMTGEAVVAYVHGIYLYIKDDTGYTMLYNSTVDGIEAGNTISNLTGKVSIYNGLFEVTNATYDSEATDIAVDPVAMQMTDITAGNMNQYVVIKNVTLSDISGRDIKLNDAAGNQFPGYSQYFCEFPEDLEPAYDVTGFVAVYNGTVQLYPVSFEVNDDVTAIEDINTGKAVVSVRYYNAAGQQAGNAFEGVNIIVTTYSDGSQSVSKAIR